MAAIVRIRLNKISKSLIKTQFKNKSIRNKWRINWYFTSGITEWNNTERPLRWFSSDAETARLISCHGEENNYPQQMNYRSLIDPKRQLFLNKHTTCSNWALCGSCNSDAPTDAADLKQPASQPVSAQATARGQRSQSLEGWHVLLWLCCAVLVKHLNRTLCFVENSSLLWAPPPHLHTHTHTPDVHL